MARSYSRATRQTVALILSPKGLPILLVLGSGIGLRILHRLGWKAPANPQQQDEQNQSIGRDS